MLSELKAPAYEVLPLAHSVQRLSAFGSENFERHGWKQLIADIENGTVQTVIVKDISRGGQIVHAPYVLSLCD